ncbi:hypothetical protein ACFWVF_38215 [Streptomyces sp. NPDC058659]|uniref:hypothetical protein n=1 Tax=unclassified Streptomyces TaxID=2593676 RepID=UPI003646094D
MTMDPIAVGLLAALAGGAGGELGRQAWAGLGVLVRRPFRRADSGTIPEPVVGPGVLELDRLAEDPADLGRAQALSTALAARAVLDLEFSAGLETWHRQVQAVRTGDGDVNNHISGGSLYGPVLQGRDFSGLTFTIPQSSTPPSAVQDDGSVVPPVQD